MKSGERRNFMKLAAAGVAALTAGDPSLVHASAAGSAKKGLRPVRRYVSGHDANGRSIFILDGDSGPAHKRAVGGVAVTELWKTSATPADNTGAAETAAGPLKLYPPADGSVFRIIDFPPEREHREALKREIAAGDDGSGIIEALKQGSAGRQAGFHRTNTIDYAIVITGEIYALMDEGERLMQVGDVLIQRGTNHAWVNRSKTVARLAFVLIDAEPAI